MNEKFLKAISEGVGAISAAQDYENDSVYKKDLTELVERMKVFEYGARDHARSGVGVTRDGAYHSGIAYGIKFVLDNLERLLADE